MNRVGTANALILFGFIWMFAAFDAIAAESQMAGPSSNDRQKDAAVTGSPWSGFDDPVLNDLVHRALRGNPGIDATNARINVAEAAAEATLAPMRPVVYAEGSYLLKDFDAPVTGSASNLLSFIEADNIDQGTADLLGINLNQLRAMQNAPSPDYPNYMQTVSAALVAKYEVDITRRYRMARQASLKEVSASREDVQAQAMTIASLVVQNYYDVVAANKRVQLIEAQIENYEKLLQLVTAQFNAGTATSLDVLQQRAQVESKKAQLPLAKTIVESGKLQLAALLDVPVETLPQIPAELPELGAAPKVQADNQLNSRLMTGRPELRAATIRLDALKIKETQAKRALLPSLAFMGKVGYGWTRINEWDGDEAWQIGATLTVPIYMGGANRTAIQLAKAQTVSAQYALENNVLQMRTQVRAAQERERAQREYLAALQAQTKVSELTVQEATRRYLAGLSNYINVLTANDVLQLNQLNLIQAERNLLSARINLLEALGGNWTRKLVTE